VNKRRYPELPAREREALLGLECALPSRELKLARPGLPVRRPLWRRALGWLRSLRERPGAPA
jgi:hypothetical protein